ncbi:MAG: hypothetical protein HOE64_02910 [Nitrospina sp.]|nr:hypothetical protein [Nitrospina sp.]
MVCGYLLIIFGNRWFCGVLVYQPNGTQIIYIVGNAMGHLHHPFGHKPLFAPLQNDFTGLSADKIGETDPINSGHMSFPVHLVGYFIGWYVMGYCIIGGRWNISRFGFDIWPIQQILQNLFFP